MEAAARHRRRRRGARCARRAPGGRRLLRADQAEGPVAAAVHDRRDDGRRGRPVARAGRSLTLLGGYLSAGGAGAINHWFDRDIDAQMARTANRPIPPGRISPRAALSVRDRARRRCRSSSCSLTVNALAASLVARGLPRLRRSSTRSGSSAATPQNIVIGGAAGAVPPLVGWAAVTGVARPAPRCTCSRSSSSGRRRTSGRCRC